MAGMPFPGEDSPMSAAEQAQALYLMLNQNDVWVDGAGRPHLIDNMTVRYKANVIAYLHRRAANLAAFYAVGARRAIDAPHDSTAVAVISEEDNPHVWLSLTPLMMRLLVDVAQGNGGSED